MVKDLVHVRLVNAVVKMDIVEQQQNSVLSLMVVNLDMEVVNVVMDMAVVK